MRTDKLTDLERSTVRHLLELSQLLVLRQQGQDVSMAAAAGCDTAEQNGAKLIVNMRMEELIDRVKDHLRITANQRDLRTPS